MARETKPTTAAVEKLEAILKSIEAWRKRYAHHDLGNVTLSAANRIDLLIGRLKQKRGEPHQVGFV